MEPRRSGPPGVTVADLRGAGPPRRYLARGADLVLVVLAGSVEVTVEPGAVRGYGAGAAAVCPRGVPWSVRPGRNGARLAVVAVPGGPERAVAALLSDPGLDDAALVAVDGGVELVLLAVRQ